MNHKVFIAATLSLGLGTALATAQTTQPDTMDVAPEAGDTDNLPSDWQGEISDAFFDDIALGTLRPREEALSNWAMLGEEQQAQVHSHCDTLDAATSNDASETDDAGAESMAGSDPDDAAASTAPDSATHRDSIAQICDWVNDM